MVTAKPAKNGKAKGAKPPAPEVAYASLRVDIHDGADYLDLLTAERAKEVIGWEEETDGTNFGADYLLVDNNGRKVRCAHNANNRPFDEAHCRKLAQDILNRHWALNGETIVVGKFGNVVSGQHRLIALILAHQLWEPGSVQHNHWSELWPTAPTMPGLIVYGVSEEDAVVRTLDNVKPRSLSDVLYTRGDVFTGRYSNADRVAMCRILQGAVNALWLRTGQRGDQFHGRLTHSEALDFLDRHPRLLKCVKHIYDDNVKTLSALISPGVAAVCMYLMGCSSSDGDAYRNLPVRTEKKLKWDLWDRAAEFWALLVTDSEDFNPVRYALGTLINDEEGASTTEKIAVIAKAWHVFKGGDLPVPGDVELEYVRDEHKVRHLAYVPDFDGIDMPHKPAKQPKPDPTPEEIEEEAERIKAENNAKKRDSGKKKGKKASDEDE